MVADIIEVSGTITVALETPACMPCCSASHGVWCFPEVFLLLGFCFALSLGGQE